MKKAVPRVLPRLLPIGALFLPLGALTIISNATAYNIVGLIKTLTGETNEFFAGVLQSDRMDPARPWLAVAAAGLTLGILAVLAGLALSLRESMKLSAASAAVYAGGTAGIILAAAGFMMFGKALAEAWRSMAGASLGYGSWVLLALLLLNAAICFFQWRAAKESARLAALAAKKRKKR